jgi:hypothetical protein
MKQTTKHLHSTPGATRSLQTLFMCALLSLSGTVGAQQQPFWLAAPYTDDNVVLSDYCTAYTNNAETACFRRETAPMPKLQARQAGRDYVAVVQNDNYDIPWVSFNAIGTIYESEYRTLMSLCPQGGGIVNRAYRLVSVNATQSKVVYRGIRACAAPF